MLKIEFPSQTEDEKKRKRQRTIEDEEKKTWKREKKEKMKDKKSHKHSKEKSDKGKKSEETHKSKHSKGDGHMVHFRGYPSNLLRPGEREDSIIWSVINSLKEMANIGRGGGTTYADPPTPSQIPGTPSTLPVIGATHSPTVVPVIDPADSPAAVAKIDAASMPLSGAGASKSSLSPSTPSSSAHASQTTPQMADFGHGRGRGGRTCSGRGCGQGRGGRTWSSRGRGQGRGGRTWSSRGRGRGRRGGAPSAGPPTLFQTSGTGVSTVPIIDAAHSPTVVPVRDPTDSPAAVAEIDAASMPLSGAGASGSSPSPSTPSSSAHALQTVPQVTRAPGSMDPTDHRIWLAPFGKLDFDPPKGPANEISKIMRTKFDYPWPTWKKIPDTVRNMWFQEFKKVYKWRPEHDREIKRRFEHRGSCIMKNAMNKIRIGKDKALWISPKVLAALREHWLGEDFKKKSETSKKNRAVDIRASSYTGGSMSIAEYRRRLTLELGAKPTAMQIMEKTKKLKFSGEWVNEKTRDIVDKFNRRRDELRTRATEEGGSSEGQHSPPPGDDTIFFEVVGGKNKKGHVYGLGQLGDYFMGSSSEMSGANPVEVQQLRDVIAKLRVEMASKDKNISELKSNLEATQSHMQQQDTRIEEQNQKIDNIQRLFQSLIVQAPHYAQPPSGH